MPSSFTLNGAPLPYGPFAVGDVNYPANVLNLWTDAELTAIGVVRVAPPEPTLDDLKAAKNAAVTVRRDAAFAQGFSPATGALAGHTLQVRNETDKINWLTSSVAYSAAVSAGAGAVPGATFRTMANETVTTTFAEAVQVIVVGMAQWGQQIMGHSWALKDQIDAAADEAALDAIDVDAGWP